MLSLPMKNSHHLDLNDGEMSDSLRDVKKLKLASFDDGYDDNYLGDARDRARLASLNELHHLEDLDDGELPDSLRDVKRPKLASFDDGYDNNYLGDKGDRARLASLNELQRDLKLYERSVKREELSNKWDIKCLIEAKEKQAKIAKEKEEQQESIKDRSSVRRLAPKAQREAEKRRNAIDRLVACRQTKKQKEEGNELELENLRAAGPSDSPKRPKLKTHDIYSDDSSEDTDEEEEHGQADESSSSRDAPDTPMTSLMELSKALLTRNQLEDFVDKPIFDQCVVGCFVRISIGPAPGQQVPVYRLSVIVAVEHTEQEYQLGGRRTKRLLHLQHGGQRCRFQMHLVSNQAVTPDEFYYWLNACKRDNQALPTLRGIANKAKDIEQASNYSFTDGDVELMVQTKRQDGQKPVSAAYRKVCLIMERDIAVDSNNLEKARQLEQEIKQIDEQSPSEHNREKRVQYMHSFVLTAPPPPAQEMRRNRQLSEKEKLAKILVPPAVLAAMGKPLVALSPPSEKKPIAVVEPQRKPMGPPESIDVDKLDLYELNNFQIKLNRSKLCKYHRQRN